MPTTARGAWLQAKAMTQAADGTKQPGGAADQAAAAGAPAAGLAGQGAFGPKYEQHLAALQKSLDEATARADALDKQLKEIS